jgi:CRP-like cAMP-binding protein
MVELNTLPGFSGIPADEMRELEAIMLAETHAAGATIFHEGEEAGAFYIVMAGQVSILKEMWGGRTLDELGPGQFFGEMGVIEEGPRCASAKAVTDVSLLKIRGDDFRELLARSPAFAMRVMATISRRNRENMSLEQMQWSGEAPVAARRGRVTLVCSMTGGAGVSTAVCNVAAELARQSGGRVCVVDASIEFGDLALMLDMVPARTLAHLAQDGVVTPEEVARTVLPTAAGFDLIPAPLRPEQSDLLSGNFFRQLLVALRASYDHIVLDTFKGLQEPMTVLLEEADQILYVLNPRLNSIKNARLWAGVLTQMDLLDGRVRYVLNGADEHHQPVPLATIEASLGTRCSAIVPVEPELVAEAAERGAVLCREQPSCSVGLAYARLAAALLAPEPKAETRPGWLKKPGWLRRLQMTTAPAFARAAGRA